MICKISYRMSEIIYKGYGKVVLIPGIKKSFGACGKNVRIGFGCDFKPAKNIFVGNNCQIGARSLFWSTRAKIVLKDYVLMGPAYDYYGRSSYRYCWKTHYRSFR